MRLFVSLAVLLSVSAVAQSLAPPAPPPAPPPMLGGEGMFRAPPGIPPHVAQKLGIAPEVVKKVRDLGFDANEALIPLEADLKRAQLDLERALAATPVDEATALSKTEAVSKAELGVRKNRLTLLLRIRKLLGPETWEKVQGEFGGPGSGMMMLGGPGGGVRHEVRIIRRDDGTTGETHDIRGQ
jgi:Spy/CpxP family protein refolding chaperone